MKDSKYQKFHTKIFTITKSAKTKQVSSHFKTNGLKKFSQTEDFMKINVRQRLNNLHGNLKSSGCYGNMMGKSTNKHGNFIFFKDERKYYKKIDLKAEFVTTTKLDEKLVLYLSYFFLYFSVSYLSYCHLAR